MDENIFQLFMAILAVLNSVIAWFLFQTSKRIGYLERKLDACLDEQRSDHLADVEVRDSLASPYIAFADGLRTDAKRAKQTSDTPKPDVSD